MSAVTERTVAAEAQFAGMIRYQPVLSPTSSISTSPWLIFGAIFVISTQIIFLYAGFQQSSECPTESVALTSTYTLRAEAIEKLNNDSCYQSGLKGQLDPNAIATIAIAPDREFWLSYYTYRRSRRQIDTVVRSYRRYSAAVNFVVITTDCTIMDMALAMGLATIRPESGTDVGDLTYNHAFVLIQKYSKTEIVGFALGDVIFGDGLVESVQAVSRARRQNKWKDVFAAATRYNIDDNDIPIAIMPINNIHGDVHGEFVKAARTKASRWLDVSSDVFLWNRDWSANWIDRPPFIFGGEGFDNWMVGWAQTRKGTVTINVTPTLEIFRIRRRFDFWVDERYQIESMLNSGVFSDKGMVGDCDLTHMKWRSYRDRSQFQEGIVNIVETKDHPL